MKRWTTKSKKCIQGEHLRHKRVIERTSKWTEAITKLPFGTSSHVRVSVSTTTISPRKQSCSRAQNLPPSILTACHVLSDISFLFLGRLVFNFLKDI